MGKRFGRRSYISHNALIRNFKLFVKQIYSIANGEGSSGESRRSSA
jgi:hypothetical protein